MIFFALLICANVCGMSVCINTDTHLSVDLFQVRRDWEAEKWIDYKNELFPTACDLPASVGLYYPDLHTLTQIANVSERDFTVLS